MEGSRDYMKKYCLNEYQYEQVKIVNKLAYKILSKYIASLYVLFKDISMYVKEPSDLVNLIKQKEFKLKNQYQTIQYILELYQNEPIPNGDNNIGNLRYYYIDVYEKIRIMLWDYFLIVFENFREVYECFEIDRCLKEAGKEKLEKVSKEIEAEYNELADYFKRNIKLTKPDISYNISS